MRAGGWVIAALLATGCVGNEAYRLTKPVLHESLTSNEIDETVVDDTPWPYKMAFIEFDDRGEMFHRSELSATIAAIESAKRTAAESTARVTAMVSGARLDTCQTRPDLCEPGPLVVTFVHGWKNNAQLDNGNVWGFRRILAGLSWQFNGSLRDELFTKLSHDAKARGTTPPSREALRALTVPVVGVYIGWRGAVISAPILKEFTFFDRHVKSQNVSGAHMVEALLRVLQAAKGSDYSQPGVSVLIGHSFGGAVLETAIAQPMMNTLLNTSSGEKIHWPATLTVLINEAQEATRSYQLIESLHTNIPRDDDGACRPPTEPPVVISVSSVADYATRAAFPAAQSIVRPLNSLRRYDDPNQPNFLGFTRQTPMFLGTTAHLDPFRSHLFGPATDPDIAAAATACPPVVDAFFGGHQYLLVEKPHATNRTPYWVMRIPASLVPDHSTIFTPAFTNLLTTMIYTVTTGKSAP